MTPPGPAKMLSIAEAIALAERSYQAGNLPQAEQIYRVVLGELHNRLGIVCGQQRKLAEAAASLQEAIRLRPDQAAPHTNLGNVWRLMGRLDDAVAAFHEALRREPGLADAHNNLGLSLMKQGRLAEATAGFRQALSLCPRYCTAASNLLLSLNYDPAQSPEALLAEHRRWPDCLDPVPPPTPFTNVRDPERRLRVGYVSPDFCGHVVAYFLLPILAHHDPAQVEVFCYAQVFDPDARTAQFRTLAHGWRSTIALDDAQVANQVRRDGVDILVDLAGHTADNRLGVFAYRPAPVQITYLGYPNTTGLPAIDYRLTDAVADPPGEPVHHTEELVRLNGPFCCYQPPERSPDVALPPVLRQGRLTFGSTHDLAKLNDPVMDLWADVLRAVPDSRLLVFRHTLTGSVKESLARRFVERGIDAARVTLESQLPEGRHYLDLYGRIDLLLDVFPWNGHVTTCESLWMGVPVVTLRGNRHAGRLSATVLSALGLTDLVADTPLDYVATAARWAADRDRLVSLRKELRPRMRSSALCDGRSFTRGLEAAYRQLWRRWCG